MTFVAKEHHGMDQRDYILAVAGGITVYASVFSCAKQAISSRIWILLGEPYVGRCKGPLSGFNHLYTSVFPL